MGGVAFPPIENASDDGVGVMGRRPAQKIYGVFICAHGG